MGLKQEAEYKHILYKNGYHRISQYKAFVATQDPKTYAVHLNVDSYEDETKEEFIEGKIYGFTLTEEELTFKDFYYNLKCLDEFFSAEDVFEGKQLDKK